MTTDECFEAVDHTADLALRVRAASLEGLFRQAVEGLVFLLTEPRRVARSRQLDIAVTGIDLEELLVGFLGEVLYRFEVDRLLLVEFADLRIGGGQGRFRLTVTAHGDEWDPDRHPILSAIKAATYHGLQIEPDGGGRFDVTIVFDT